MQSTVFEPHGHFRAKSFVIYSQSTLPGYLAFVFPEYAFNAVITKTTTTMKAVIENPAIASLFLIIGAVISKFSQMILDGSGAALN